MRGWAAILAVSLTACGRDRAPDAYGNVEATEVVVSSEVTGQLTSFMVSEGQTLAEGAAVATVDPTQLTLERSQAAAQQAVNASRVIEVARQIPVLEAQRQAAEAQRDAASAQRAGLASQLEIARRVHERNQRLFAQQAATAQQIDQSERDYRVLEDQLKAQDQQIAAQSREIEAQTGRLAAVRAQQQTASQQVGAAETQVAQVEERLRKAQVTNPIAGTVLVTYVEQGEVVQAGRPLYKIANLSAVDVRAYVTEPQLASVKLGQEVRVTHDLGSEARPVASGTITWVSSTAEFTPTPIQTRDERSDLVYAIKIRVANPNGALKIGMPVDVEFAP